MKEHDKMVEKSSRSDDEEEDGGGGGERRRKEINEKIITMQMTRRKRTITDYDAD